MLNNLGQRIKSVWKLAKIRDKEYRAEKKALKEKYKTKLKAELQAEMDEGPSEVV